MSIQIEFFKTNSDPRALRKNLIPVSTLNCDLLETTTIANPAMVVDLPETMKGVNYMYIADFNRYYFCKTEIINGSLCRITGKCDVLMSFKTGILNTRILLDRTANDELSNLYFNDEKIRKYAYERTQCKAFPNSVFNQNGYCILITAGGVAPANA